MSMRVSRMVALGWGSFLVALAGIPLVVALAQGFDPYDSEGVGLDAAALLTVAWLVVGVVSMAGAITGNRGWAWPLILAVPVLVALGLMVNADLGDWASPVWRPVLAAGAALFPALLLRREPLPQPVTGS